MNLSRRDRRDLRIFLSVNVAAAIISAIFSLNVAPAGSSWVRAIWQGVSTSLLIATPIMIYELRSRRPGALRVLRRMPLGIYFGLKVLIYLVFILIGLFGMRLMMPGPFHLDETFRSSLLFSFAMSVAGNLIFEIGGLLGFGTLMSLFTGRYVRPRREERAFLLIDMKNSTGHAERLGPVAFHELLNEFFRDIADAALECDAEIHKYVGDEAILTWRGDAALKDGSCLSCAFMAFDLIARHSKHYLARYGAVPEFRATLHYGEIVAGEIGDIRREIAFVGDTLNVAARLLEVAKAGGQDVLVSQDLLERTRLPADLVAERLPTLTVRGRSAPLGASALTRR
jgi:adenylate cyclase